jgi:PilZ domain
MATYVSADVPADYASIQRSPRYVFIAKFKATDAISGKQVEGLTTDLSEGGCCLMMRKGPFSPGTPVVLEISRNGVLLSTKATVVYNLKDQIIGVQFSEMTVGAAAIHEGWIKAARAASEPNHNKTKD